MKIHHFYVAINNLLEKRRAANASKLTGSSGQSRPVCAGEEMKPVGTDNDGFQSPTS